MAVAPPPIASPRWGEKSSEGVFFKHRYFQKAKRFEKISYFLKNYCGLLRKFEL